MGWRVAAAAGMGLALILALHPGGRLLRVEWLLYASWLLPGLAVAAWVRRRTGAPWIGLGRRSRLWPVVVLLGFLCLYLLSSTARHHLFYGLSWSPGKATVPGPLDSGLARFWLITAVLTPFFVPRWRRLLTWALAALLLASQGLALFYFLRETQGCALYRDDHASFLYRLWIFGRTFPQLVYYNPFWNGGKVATYLISSGSCSIGVFLWPLWRWFPAQVVYTPVIGGVFIGLVPLLAVLSVRVARGSWQAAFCAGVLALGPCRLFLLHLLHFGTIGSLFATAFIMPVSACLYRVLWLDRHELRIGLLLAIGTVFLLMWPGSVFVMLPVGVSLLVAIGRRRLSVAKARFFLITGAVVGVCLLPFLTGLLRHADMRAFSEITPDGTFAWGPVLMEGWASLRTSLAGGHPLLLFLGLGAVFIVRDRRQVWWYVPMLPLYLVLAGWGNQWKPQFQFDRLAIPLFFLLVSPAAMWAARFLAKRDLWLAPLRASLVALLALGALSTAQIYGNRGVESYRTVSLPMRDMTAWLRTHTPPDGRILFAGRTVHGYGAGHVAALSLLAGRDMMACDYYAFSTKKVEYDYPPALWRQGGKDKLFAFMDLYNVTHVATYHPDWKRVFRQFPDQYEESASFMQRTLEITVFRLRRTSSMFLRGQGTVTPSINELRLRVADPGGDVVLRYNWVPGLSVLGPAELYPVEMAEDITFIGVRPNGVQDLRITFGRQRR